MAIWEFIRHLDDHIAGMIKDYGAWTYGILFTIVFAETGLVVTPFLPGDTLLFAAGLFSRPETQDRQRRAEHLDHPGRADPGAACRSERQLSLGQVARAEAVRNEKSKFFNKDHLDRTHAFFDKHGGKTVILARWIPIVRTFAPFVAGMGAMPYRKFLGFSIAGACLGVGHLSRRLLARAPALIRDNFEWAMIIMIFITGGPVLFEYCKGRMRSKRDASASGH